MTSTQLSFCSFEYLAPMFVRSCEEKYFFSEETISTSDNIGEDDLESVTDMRYTIHIGNGSCDEFMRHGDEYNLLERNTRTYN
jgi:hypothetical protein